jgi:hypothetical protein
MDQLKESTGFVTGTFKISEIQISQKSLVIYSSTKGFKVTQLNSVFKSIER